MTLASFHIHQNDQTGQFEVVKNGAVVRAYRSEAEAQNHIDTYRQAAARLKVETADELPLDALTDSERQVLYPDQS